MIYIGMPTFFSSKAIFCSPDFAIAGQSDFPSNVIFDLAGGLTLEFFKPSDVLGVVGIFFQEGEGSECVE
jgi:hypothetical protein